MANKFNKWPVIALVLMVISPNYLLAADSTITITGTIKEGGCVVSPDSQEFTVNLLSHATKQFTTVGSVTQAVPFSITLSSCGSGISTVKVGFIGSADTRNTAMLAIDGGANAASGIAIQIMNSDRATIPINSDSSVLKAVPVVTDHDNILMFNARMIATQLPITSGLVTATATFTLQYE